MLPALERHHDVLALTLAGHAGGPPIQGEITDQTLADAVERTMDEAGMPATAHLVGNSLGGWVALQLAARGRARTVVALAPAGGWAPGDHSYKQVLRLQRNLVALAKATAPHAHRFLETAEGRRRATRLITVNHEHIPAELLAHQALGVAGCTEGARLVDYAITQPWDLDADRIACPVRVVWGAEDQLLPWPSAAARFRSEWLPHADWVELDDVGHCPQLDVPVEAAELILGLTSG
jgi:pimeloyl-ACP methyl ester carboxylesterase